MIMIRNLAGVGGEIALSDLANAERRRDWEGPTREAAPPPWSPTDTSSDGPPPPAFDRIDAATVPHRHRHRSPTPLLSQPPTPVQGVSTCETVRQTTSAAASPDAEHNGGKSADAEHIVHRPGLDGDRAEGESTVEQNGRSQSRQTGKPPPYAG